MSIQIVRFITASLHMGNHLLTIHDLVEKRDEVVHAQYASQLRQDRVNPLTTAQTMVSAFLLDQMLTSECGLGIFMAIWARLRTDCSEIYHWVKDPQNVVRAVLFLPYIDSNRL